MRLKYLFYVEHPSNMNIDQYGAGALLGALCGDAAGAVLEFHPNPIEESDVSWALSMPGGGQLHVGKGQITDDGELTIALCRALFGQSNGGQNNSDGQGSGSTKVLPEEAIAESYRAWIHSNPFDIGQTINNAFFVRDHEYARGFLAPQIRKVVKKTNFWSESNGAMMRCVPMAMWLHDVPWAKAVECIRSETSLSHSSAVVIDANIAYIMALRHLLLHPDGVKGALAAAESHLYGGADPVVVDWYNISRDDVRMKKYVAKPQIGHVKHGFVLAFYHLRKRSSYRDALTHTLMAGGDTDTNGAIVGGMIGGLVGYNGIPRSIKIPVLEFDCTRAGEQRGKKWAGHKRPIEYSVIHCFDCLLDDNIRTVFKEGGEEIMLEEEGGPVFGPLNGEVLVSGPLHLEGVPEGGPVDLEEYSEGGPVDLEEYSEGGPVDLVDPHL